MSKVEPENQFGSSDHRVRQVLDRYGLGGASFEPAIGGIENSTFIVYSDDERFVLRVYRQNNKSLEDISLELDFMAVLREHGLPIPRVIQSTLGNHCEIVNLDGHEWQCVVMDHASGIQPKSYGSALVDEMAILHARMHDVGVAYARKHRLPVQRKTLREAYGTRKLLADVALDGYFRDFLERVGAFEIAFDSSLRTGFSHFDYHAKNLLADESGRITAILDFDDAKCLPLITCLGYTLYDLLVSTDIDVQLLSRYLQGYQTARPLITEEKEILPKIVLFRHYVSAVLNMRLGALDRADLDDVVRQEIRLKAISWDILSPSQVKPSP